MLFFLFTHKTPVVDIWQNSLCEAIHTNIYNMFPGTLNTTVLKSSNDPSNLELHSNCCYVFCQYKESSCSMLLNVPIISKRVPTRYNITATQ